MGDRYNKNMDRAARWGLAGPVALFVLAVGAAWWMFG